MQYRGLTLDPFQSDAIGHLEAGRSVLVCAPTGTGKTIIADWLVEQALAAGRRIVYTAPVKALSNQKFRDYTRLYGEEAVGLLTGDLVIRRDAPCRVMTTEILRNMLLGDEPLHDLHAVIVDEIHFLDDRERGTVWEEILIYLPPTVQILGLSATLSNVREFAAWLSHVRGATVEVIEEYKRAVPLHFYLASSETGLLEPEAYERAWRRFAHYARRGAERRPQRGRGKDRDQQRFRKRTRHTDVLSMLHGKDMLPALYFAFSRRDIENNARHLGRRIPDSLLSFDQRAAMETRLTRASKEIGPALEPELMELYRKGIAFHHAGLHVQLKALVEELYESHLIEILYCTSTFALGINMPARSVVFDGLFKYDGQGTRPLRIREFMQKAGRAGRRGLDHTGHVAIRTDVEEFEAIKPLVQRYLSGVSEPVRSSFNLSWNSIVNLLATHDEAHLREIVSKSFLHWQVGAEAQRATERAEAALRDVEESEAKSRVIDKQKRLALRQHKRAAKASDRAWDQVQARIKLLQQVGYLGGDLQQNAGARLLCHLQIEEILVTEILLHGLLEPLDDAHRFGVLCGLVAELPRAATRNYGLNKADRQLARDIQDLRESPVVTEAERIAGLPAHWDPEMMPLGRAWAEGKSLQDVLAMVSAETDIAGDLVTGFRRAKDLAGQLADAHQSSPEDEARWTALGRRVARDEVEVVD